MILDNFSSSRGSLWSSSPNTAFRTADLLLLPPAPPVLPSRPLPSRTAHRASHTWHRRDTSPEGSDEGVGPFAPSSERRGATSESQKTTASDFLLVGSRRLGEVPFCTLFSDLGPGLCLGSDFPGVLFCRNSSFIPFSLPSPAEETLLLFLPPDNTLVPAESDRLLKTGELWLGFGSNSPDSLEQMLLPEALSSPPVIIMEWLTVASLADGLGTREWWSWEGSSGPGSLCECSTGFERSWKDWTGVGGVGFSREGT